ncbi:MAG: helix-turn-helix domain-containing protein [Rubrobacteraceae bacterium]
MEEERSHLNGNSDDSAKIGGILERARKERGLSLQDVEQATKIRKRYLDGLEREDYGVLPDSVYAQGFLKTYANYLGLDGEELSRDLKRRRGRRRDQRQFDVGEIKKSGFERPVLSPGGLSQAQGRRISPATLLTLVIAVVALGAVISALYYIGRDTQTVDSSPPPAAEQEPPGDEGVAQEPESDAESDAAEENPPEEAGEEEPAAEEPAAEEPPADPESLAVTVSVEGAESWISVSADGSVAYSQIAQPGFSETFEAQNDILLSTGNAGAVEVEVNGQDLGVLGESGEVLDRSFTLKDAS